MSVRCPFAAELFARPVQERCRGLASALRFEVPSGSPLGPFSSASHSRPTGSNDAFCLVPGACAAFRGSRPIALRSPRACCTRGACLLLALQTREWVRRAGGRTRSSSGREHPEAVYKRRTGRSMSSRRVESLPLSEVRVHPKRVIKRTELRRITRTAGNPADFVKFLALQAFVWVRARSGHDRAKVCEFFTTRSERVKSQGST